MNRGAIVFHGTAAHPDVIWLPSSRGFNVRDDGQFGNLNQPYESFELPAGLID